MLNVKGNCGTIKRVCEAFQNARQISFNDCEKHKLKEPQGEHRLAILPPTEGGLTAAVPPPWRGDAGLATGI